MRRILAALTLTTAMSAASAQDLTALDDAGRSALRAEIRAYLLDNPEVLIEALDVLESRRMEAAMSAQQDTLYNDPNSFTGGNPEGDIRLVEFVDYRCGYCKRAHPVIASLVEADGNIKLIRKEFPILGEASIAAARFALATRQIHGDAAYAQISDALMESPGAAIAPTLFQALAQQYELDWAEIEPRMASDEITAALAANHQLGQGLDIRSTPSFVIEDKIVSGALPRAEFEAVIAAARAEAESE